MVYGSCQGHILTPHNMTHIFCTNKKLQKLYNSRVAYKIFKKTRKKKLNRSLEVKYSEICACVQRFIYIFLETIVHFF